MRAPTPLVCSILLCLICCTPPPAAASDLALTGDFLLPDSLFAPALEAAGLRAEELNCFPAYNERDPFRLSLVEALMAEPAASDALLAPLLEDLLAREAADPWGAPEMGILGRLPRWLDAEPEQPLAWEQVRRELLRDQGESPMDPAAFFSKLLPRLTAHRADALADLDQGELVWLRRESPRLMEELEHTDEIRDPLTLRRLEMELSARGDSTLALWERVDRSRLLLLGDLFARSSAWYAQILYQERYQVPGAEAEPAYPAGHRFQDGSLAEGPLHYVAESAYGNLVVGAADENRYTGNFLFILDLGGDDRYRLDSNWPDVTELLVESKRGWRCLYDMGGDDRYEARADGALASGLLGAGLLVDEWGDDSYRAGSFDLGCGWLGTGLLFDRAGDDVYQGDMVVMGAGGAGFGLLRDEGGQDLYHAHLYAQGFAYVGGLGILEERGGSDLYAASPKYTDILRYEDHSLTLSQGFAIGARPHYSGGIGILYDSAGNDSYLTDIYGQGCAYWYGLGLLWDRQGNDRYECYQYGQGAGIHLALGYLLDDRGNDSYSSHGVGQGCGHDLALGLLRDGQGNDRYSCDDLSQGAGSANGIGLLLDAAGLDGYLSKSATAPAYGNPRRNFGSVGIAVDGSGEDWGSRALSPGERRGSLLGLWLDRDVPLAGPVWDPGEPAPFAEADYGGEDYFLMASSGEPRFRLWRQAGFDSLVAHPDAAIGVLIGHLDTDMARQRHTIKDLMKAIGVPAVDPLREVLREGPPAYWRVAAWCLENIRDARAFPELMGLLEQPRDFRDQVAALAALARLENLDDAARAQLASHCAALVDAAGTHPLVLKEVATLLGQQELGPADLLVTLVMADHYAPRWVAVRALSAREHWSPAFAKAWLRQCAASANQAPADDSGSEALIRLCQCLPQLPAQAVRDYVRQAQRAGCLGDPRFGRALLRSLADHPDAEGLVLGSLFAQLKEEFYEIRVLR